MNKKKLFTASALLTFLLAGSLNSSLAVTSSDISIPNSESECLNEADCKSKDDALLPPPLSSEDAQQAAKQEIEQNTLKATEEETTQTQSEEELKLIDERLKEMEKRHLENVDKLISQFDDKFSTDLDPLSLDNPLDQNTALKEKLEPKKPELLNNFKGSGIYIGGYPIEAILAILLPPLLYSLWHLARKALGKS